MKRTEEMFLEKGIKEAGQKNAGKEVDLGRETDLTKEKIKVETGNIAEIFLLISTRVGVQVGTSAELETRKEDETEAGLETEGGTEAAQVLVVNSSVYCILSSRI